MRVFDDGLQLERTTLAWDRTGLAFIANGLLITRLAGEATWVRGVGYLAVALAAVPLLAGRRRHVRRDADLRRGRSARRTRSLVMVGVAAITVSLLALAAAVTALP
jgi:uncharacterized membrane protein YidH (DUF202 family)